ALADRMHIEPPTLVGILDRMERDGWISRQDCATDRRKKMIRLQPQADPVWHDILQCAKSVRARATSGMTSSEVDTLRELLTKVQVNLSSETAIDSVAPAK